MPTFARSQARLNSVFTCLSTTVKTLDTLSSGFDTPFLKPISSTVQSLLSLMETTKRNKNDCALLLEQINAILSAVIGLHLNAGLAAELPPDMLVHVGNFTMTLHKIHTFVEAQQDGNRIKKLFRRTEMSALLKDCKAGLQQVQDVLKVETAGVLCDFHEMEKQAIQLHEDVLELVQSLSETTSSATASTSISRIFSGVSNSSTSLSMLPSQPKIFHGRHKEISDILELFATGTPRIAILGAGGMGKTSLARAVVHHPELALRYQEHRFFVSCDSTSTKEELAFLIAAHLELKPGKDVMKQIVQRLQSTPPCLLILDNLEAVWEPFSSRVEVEKFLALLTGVSHAALIITMRGAERPGGVQWTRPFLHPLQRLTSEAARMTFIDIADEMHDNQDIDKLLHLTGNMPLAISLLAHLVDSEGLDIVLCRWETEKTSVVSDGSSRSSNLDISISVSISSPRVESVPGTKQLLSLLSILPDGLSDTELLQAQLPLTNILLCKSTLLRTSLAYLGSQKRLKLLVPIREYVQRYHPPSSQLAEPLFQKYQDLLRRFEKHRGTLLAEINPQLASNSANIHNMLSFQLENTELDSRNTIYCAVKLNMWNRAAGKGTIPLMERIPQYFPQPTDHRLEVYFRSEFLIASKFQKIPNAQALIERTVEYFSYFGDLGVKCQFYSNAGKFYQLRSNFAAATEFYQRALALAESGGSEFRQDQSQVLVNLAAIKWFLGDYVAGHKLALQAHKLSTLEADLIGEAHALVHEGMCLYALGSYSEGIEKSQRAHHLLKLCGMHDGEMSHRNLLCLGLMHFFKSEYSRAREIQTSVLSALEPGSYEYAVCRINIAQSETAMGSPTQDIQTNIDTAMPICLGIGVKLVVATCNVAQADLFLRDGKMLSAKSILGKHLKLAWGDCNEVTQLTLEKLADVRRWNPAYWGYRWPIVFLMQAIKSKQRLATYKALQFIACITLAGNDQATAASLFTVALEGFSEMDIHRSRAECMLELGDICRSKGNLQGAAELWKRAHPLFERSSQTEKIVMIEDRLSSLKKQGCRPDTNIPEMAEERAPSAK